MSTTLYRKPTVCQRLGVSKSTLHRLIKAQKFPAPIRITDRIVGWPQSLVDAWIEEKAKGGGQ